MRFLVVLFVVRYRNGSFKIFIMKDNKQLIILSICFQKAADLEVEIGTKKTKSFL